MIRATVASEWTKLWSVRSTWWALVGALALMLLSSMQVAYWVDNGDTSATAESASDVAASAFAVAQLAVLAVAMLAVTGEYSHRTIRATLQWTPARTRVLLAKAAVVAAVTAATGAGLAVAGTLTAAPILTDAPAIQISDLAAIAVSSSLLGLLALGLGTALRGAVVTLVVLFLLLFVIPPLLATPDVAALTWIADLTPGPAGTHFLAGDHDPYPPLVGALVMAAWSVAALSAGRTVLRNRDA
ncbi:ABC transporter permease [Virgisporangium aurantiacum]|uniref:ABC transporter n=1 Tax=Virgisporangium aurantiacum TaxID=175570 RepID=A0A8J4E310_9ACTN|nr:ABC transporter permease [Virgisporangium aurantiacum]GIJ59576.1 ABC transporter [Virgisporangium aurantiacum]